MSRFSLRDRHAPLASTLNTGEEECRCLSPLRIAGMATLVLGVISLGLYAGRELRVRYKFRHRTPSDFFSRAGELGNSEYGMGI